MTDPINILIVDDHTLFRESIARLLDQEAGFCVAGICGDLEETRRILSKTAVDVILLDYDLNGEVGTDLVTTVGASYPRTKILMVTGGVGLSVARRSIQAGVAGLVLKHSSPQQLVEAVRSVAVGGSWWDQKTISSLAAPQVEVTLFTERQRRILSLLLDGLSNKELAVQLDTSETAVKASLQELFRKTGVRTRSQLVRIAIEASGEDT